MHDNGWTDICHVRWKQTKISMFFLSRCPAVKFRPFTLSAVHRLHRPPSNDAKHFNDKKHARLLRVVEKRVEERKRLLCKVQNSTFMGGNTANYCPDLRGNVVSRRRLSSETIQRVRTSTSSMGQLDTNPAGLSTPHLCLPHQ